MTWRRGPKITSAGLVFCFDAGNPKCYPGTGSTAHDLSGGNRDGALTNVAFSSANLGQFTFNGINSYIPFSTSGLPYGTSPSTLEVWAMSYSLSSSWCWYLTYGQGGGGQSRFLGTNGPNFYFGGYGSDLVIGGVVANRWNHLVGTFDGSTAIMYLNGAQIGQGTFGWNTVQNNAQLGRQTNGGEYLYGSVAVARIYNRVLTPDEIRQNYDAQRSRYGL